MLRKLLSKLGKWDETMAVAAFAEAGDFSMMGKALAKERRSRNNLRRKSAGRKYRGAYQSR